MNTKLFIASLIAVFAAASYWMSTKQGAHTATTTEQKPLIVGTNVGYPPFIFTDEYGKVTGFDAEVAAAIAQKLNRTLVVKDMAFDALLLALPQGSVDMIIGGISITQQRKASGLLIPYYGTKVDTIACFYQAASTLKALSLEDAAARHYSVCTQAGSVFEEILQQHPGIIIKTLPDISDIFLEVSQGHSDMGMLDVDSVRALTRTHPELAAHTITLPAHQIIEGFGIGVSPHSPLRDEIDAAITALHTDGTIPELARLWFNLDTENLNNSAKEAL